LLACLTRDDIDETLTRDSPPIALGLRVIPSTRPARHDCYKMVEAFSSGHAHVSRVESLVEQGFSVSGNTLEAAKVPTPAPQRRQ
jgi:hypothetical protein